jgi:hypothetical protein
MISLRKFSRPKTSSRRQVQGQGAQLGHQRVSTRRVEGEVALKVVLARGGIVGELAREATKTVDEVVDVDPQRVAGRRHLPPRRRLSHPAHLGFLIERAVAEDLEEALEALDLAGRQRFAAGKLPQGQEREGEVPDRPPHAALVDAHLAQVEQHALVEAALVHVAADLRLVGVEIALGAALGIEHEPMGHQIDRREVRLAAQAAELLEIAIGREAEEPLQQLTEQRLGQRLLVLGRGSATQVVGDVRGSGEARYVPARASSVARRRSARSR